MSFSDKPRESRTARRARPRQSLKMQAIGFLSRREYSRQELRAKLLDSLRKRAREDAARAVAAEAAARELAQALAEQPSNGIDDAFAPRVPAASSEPAFAAGRGRPFASADGHAPTPARVTRGAARAGAQVDAPPRAGAPADVPDDVDAGATDDTRRRRANALHAPAAGRDDDAVSTSPAVIRAALTTLTRGDGGALPPGLRARLDAVVAEDVAARAPAAGRQERIGAVGDDPGDFPIDADDDAFTANHVATGDRGREPRGGAAAARGAFAGEASDASDDLERTDPEAAVDQLLDWLVANKYLSETRFVESRVNARARKQGSLRIKLELSRHGLTLEPEQVAALRETEFARAQALWQRKFGVVPTEPRERAKQARFLAARGFAADVVRRVIGGLDED